MSKPLALAVLALAAGILVADRLFYEASVAVPPWLGVALWSFCLLLCGGALVAYRRLPSVPQQRCLFVAVTLLFFFVVGFARYASQAEAVRKEWNAMDRPPTNRGNPDEFDYRRWRWVRGAEASPVSLIGRCRQGALRVREYLIQRYVHEGLDGETLALVTAVTLGDRSRLTRSVRDLYAEAGASHLLALSGLHLGIIVGFALTWLQGPLVRRRSRWLVAVLMLLFIWAFAFVAALPTSLVRAALMMTVLIFALMLRRSHHALQPLLLTAWLMLLVRPFYLFDVGAQLSFAAVAGIFLLHDRWWQWGFYRWRFVGYWLQRHHLLWILQLFSVSVAAQLATLPIVLVCFHRFPLYAPVFNILFVPLTTLLVYGALFLLFLSLVASLLTLHPVGSMVVVGLGSLFSGLAGCSLTGLLARGLTWLVAVQMSLMQVEVRLPGAVVRDFWSRPAAPQVIVYHARRCPALHVIASPSESWLLMPQPDSLDVGLHTIAASFWERRLKAPPVVLRQRAAVVLPDYSLLSPRRPLASAAVSASPSVTTTAAASAVTAETHLATAAGPGPTATAASSFCAVMIHAPVVLPSVQATSVTPQSVDLLWVTRGFRGARLDTLSRLYRPRLLVLDASLPRWQREALAAEALRCAWRVYDVAVQGALCLPLHTL